MVDSAACDLPRAAATHASALIAAGVDVVAISQRLGHANPTVTLNIYGHLFKKDDGAAIEAALRCGREG
jgi:integrase